MKDNQLSIPGGLPQNIIRYQTERGEVALSVAFVRQHFAPKATPQEAFTFIKLCQFHSLNPFLREAYIIKYKEGEHATYIIGKDAWATRAAQQPSYDGLIAGIIVQKAETLEYRASAFFLPGESIVGGWCEVRRKDRSQPTRIEVAMAEYNKKQSLWLTLPATMIRKVATVHALREAYPGLFGGLYDASEMGTGEELPVDPMIIEGTGTWIDDDTEEDADVVAPPRTVNGTSTGDPSRGSAPSGNRHPWLVTCPEHDVRWFQTGNMREPAHRVGNEWCNFSKVVGPMVDNSRSRLLAERGMSGAGFTSWLKATYQAAWSGLKIDQRLDALETFAQEHPRGTTADADNDDGDFATSEPPEGRREPSASAVVDNWQPGDPLPDRVDDRDQLLRIVEAHDWDQAALENQICGGSLEGYLTRHQVTHLYDLWRKMAGE